MRFLLAQLGCFTLTLCLAAASVSPTLAREPEDYESFMFSTGLAHQADTLMIPASTMKLVTASWALTQLGRDFVINEHALRNLAPQSVALLQKYFRLFRTSEADPLKRPNYEVGTAKVGPLIDRFLHRSTNSLGAILALVTYGQGNRFGRYLPGANDFDNALIEMRGWFSTFIAKECPGRADFVFGGFSGLNDLYWTQDYSNLEFELSILPKALGDRGVARKKMSGTLISARALSCLLKTMTRHSRFSDLLASMANPGQEGSTLNGRLGDGKEPNSSRIYGKTGTLTGVAALAGFMQRPNGTFATFAYFINRPRSSKLANRARIDKVVLDEFRKLSGLAQGQDAGGHADIVPGEVPVMTDAEKVFEDSNFGEEYFE